MKIIINSVERHKIKRKQRAPLTISKKSLLNLHKLTKLNESTINHGIHEE